MEIAMFAMMIPISAIVLGVGGGIVQNILKSQERRLELRLQVQQGKNEDVTRQLETMRAETKAAPAPVSVSQSEQYQRMGQG